MWRASIRAFPRNELPWRRVWYYSGWGCGPSQWLEICRLLAKQTGHCFRIKILALSRRYNFDRTTAAPHRQQRSSAQELHAFDRRGIDLLNFFFVKVGNCHNRLLGFLDHNGWQLGQLNWWKRLIFTIVKLLCLHNEFKSINNNNYYLIHCSKLFKLYVPKPVDSDTLLCFII